MPKVQLGKLSQVDLREYWKHEAQDFTQWLAEHENLSLLGDELGIDIELIQTEANVGRYNADILAREETSDRKIVIENQLETTDHNHLGQVLTYAAGVEAEYIVWIVKDVREEHRQAIDWLNEHTDEKVNFFLVRIELWQIDGSALAPKFAIISRPNDWTKSVRESVKEKTLTPTTTKQLEFWEELHSYATQTNAQIKLRKPRAQHWYDVAIGRSDCYVSFTFSPVDNQISCELYIPDAKEVFNAFQANKEVIEQILETNAASWQYLPESKASRVRITRPYNCTTEEKNDAFNWLIQTYFKFKKAFAKS